MKRIFTIKHALLYCLCLGLSMAYSQTYTFTNCGATGQDGPSGPEITAEYEGTTLEGLVTGVSGIQYWTVPSDGEYSIEVFGAEGGADGGLGARMYGEFLLTAGQEIKILVGQEGGSLDGLHGSGGGGSFVAYADDDTPLIVAGGGGGHGKTAPGINDEADGTIDEDGQDPGGGGPGGTDGGGGAAASGLTGGTRDTPGADATGSTWSSGGGGFYTAGGGMNAGDTPGGRAFVDGGQGGDASTGALTAGGFGGGGGAGDRGAGGGGYSGGGGGRDNTVGGGGGGSYNDGTNQDNESGVRSGHGLVEITILCNPLTITVTDYDPCINEYITLTAESETGGIITWEDGVEDGVPFIPGAPGPYYYTVNSTSPEDCSPTIEINVRPFPTVIANASPTELCAGESLILYGDGAETYTWEPGGLDDRAVIYPEEGTHTYTATGTDEFGCIGTDEVDVLVFPEPELEITADKLIICQGDEVTLTASGGIEYDWDHPVENGIPFIIDAIGEFTYEVEMEDINGCEAEGEVTITVGAPIEVTYTTTEEIFGDDGAIDITVSGGTPPYSFDWDNDGTGDFDDPEDLTGIAGGTYVVVVNDAGTCSQTETMTISSQLGIENNDLINVHVFPNPFYENITVKVNGEFTYQITSALGQTVMMDKAKDQANLNLKGLAKGSYFVTINSNEETRTVKIIKQ